MFTIAVGTTLTGKEIVLNPYAQSMDDIAPLFKKFSEPDLFDALMAIEYLILAAKRDEGINLGWESTLQEHHNFLLTRLRRRLILKYKTALNLPNAFKARDYGKQRVHEKYRAL